MNNSPKWQGNHLPVPLLWNPTQCQYHPNVHRQTNNVQESPSLLTQLQQNRDLSDSSKSGPMSESFERGIDQTKAQASHFCRPVFNLTFLEDSDSFQEFHRKTDKYQESPKDLEYSYLPRNDNQLCASPPAQVYGNVFHSHLEKNSAQHPLKMCNYKYNPQFPHCSDNAVNELTYFKNTLHENDHHSRLKWRKAKYGFVGEYARNSSPIYSPVSSEESLAPMLSSIEFQHDSSLESTSRSHHEALSSEREQFSNTFELPSENYFQEPSTRFFPSQGLVYKDQVMLQPRKGRIDKQGKARYQRNNPRFLLSTGLMANQHLLKEQIPFPQSLQTESRWPRSYQNHFISASPVFQRNDLRNTEVNNHNGNCYRRSSQPHCPGTKQFEYAPSHGSGNFSVEEPLSASQTCHSKFPSEFNRCFQNQRNSSAYPVYSSLSNQPSPPRSETRNLTDAHLLPDILTLTKRSDHIKAPIFEIGNVRESHSKSRPFNKEPFENNDYRHQVLQPPDFHDAQLDFSEQFRDNRKRVGWEDSSETHKKRQLFPNDFKQSKKKFQRCRTDPQKCEKMSGKKFTENNANIERLLQQNRNNQKKNVLQSAWPNYRKRRWYQESYTTPDMSGIHYSDNQDAGALRERGIDANFGDRAHVVTVQDQGQNVGGRLWTEKRGRVRGQCHGLRARQSLNSGNRMRTRGYSEFCVIDNDVGIPELACGGVKHAATDVQKLCMFIQLLKEFPPRENCIQTIENCVTSCRYSVRTYYKVEELQHKIDEKPVFSGMLHLNNIFLACAISVSKKLLKHHIYKKALNILMTWPVDAILSQRNPGHGAGEMVPDSAGSLGKETLDPDAKFKVKLARLRNYLLEMPLVNHSEQNYLERLESALTNSGSELAHKFVLEPMRNERGAHANIKAKLHLDGRLFSEAIACGKKDAKLEVCAKAMQRLLQAPDVDSVLQEMKVEQTVGMREKLCKLQERIIALCCANKPSVLQLDMAFVSSDCQLSHGYQVKNKLYLPSSRLYSVGELVLEGKVFTRAVALRKKEAKRKACENTIHKFRQKDVDAILQDFNGEVDEAEIEREADIMFSCLDTNNKKKPAFMLPQDGLVSVLDEFIKKLNFPSSKQVNDVIAIDAVCLQLKIKLTAVFKKMANKESEQRICCDLYIADRFITSGEGRLRKTAQVDAYRKAMMFLKTSTGETILSLPALEESELLKPEVLDVACKGLGTVYGSNRSQLNHAKFPPDCKRTLKNLVIIEHEDWLSDRLKHAHCILLHSATQSGLLLEWRTVMRKGLFRCTIRIQNEEVDSCTTRSKTSALHLTSAKVLFRLYETQPAIQGFHPDYSSLWISRDELMELAEKMSPPSKSERLETVINIEDTLTLLPNHMNCDTQWLAEKIDDNLAKVLEQKMDNFFSRPTVEELVFAPDLHVAEKSFLGSLARSKGFRFQLVTYRDEQVAVISKKINLLEMVKILDSLPLKAQGRFRLLPKSFAPSYNDIAGEIAANDSIIQELERQNGAVPSYSALSIAQLANRNEAPQSTSPEQNHDPTKDKDPTMSRRDDFSDSGDDNTVFVTCASRLSEMLAGEGDNITHIDDAVVSTEHVELPRPQSTSTPSRSQSNFQVKGENTLANPGFINSSTFSQMPNTERIQVTSVVAEECIQDFALQNINVLVEGIQDCETTSSVSTEEKCQDMASKENYPVPVIPQSSPSSIKLTSQQVISPPFSTFGPTRESIPADTVHLSPLADRASNLQSKSNLQSEDRLSYQILRPLEPSSATLSEDSWLEVSLTSCNEGNICPPDICTKTDRNTEILGHDQRQECDQGCWTATNPRLQ